MRFCIETRKQLTGYWVEDYSTILCSKFAAVQNLLAEIIFIKITQQSHTLLACIAAAGEKNWRPQVWVPRVRRRAREEEKTIFLSASRVSYFASAAPQILRYTYKLRTSCPTSWKHSKTFCCVVRLTRLLSTTTLDKYILLWKVSGFWGSTVPYPLAQMPHKWPAQLLW